MLYVSGIKPNYFTYYKNTFKYTSKLKEIHVIKLFTEVKNEFYNTATYKWGINEAMVYTKAHQLEPLKLIEFLEFIFSRCQNLPSPPIGLKSALSFIKRLEKSKKFNSINSATANISLKNSKEVIKFLSDMKVINDQLDITHDEMVNFIHTHFNTGLTSLTLRRYYFENKQ